MLDKEIQVKDEENEERIKLWQGNLGLPTGSTHLVYDF
jgi:hypothetical protein